MLYRCNVCGRLFNKEIKTSNIFEQLMCEDCLNASLKNKLTLGLGVLHYKESSEMILHALQTVDNQKKFNFDNLTVIVVTDGEGIKLDESFINSHLKNIKPTYYYKQKNSHCGGVRNTIIKTLDTDYIMFMDCDDEFCNNKAFSRIYKKLIEHTPDVYYSGMLEELYNGKCLKYNNLMGLHMCHGKAYNKNFLVRNKIKFDEKLRVSEDIGFNMKVYNLSNKLIFDDRLISYKWKYHSGSLTRENDIVLKLDSYYRCFHDALTEFNKWFFEIKDKNEFVNDNFVSMMYNLLYYRIQTTKFKDKKLKDMYIKKYFDYVTYPNLNFKLTDKIDKIINRKLMRRIPYFSEAYKKYKTLN